MSIASRTTCVTLPALTVLDTPGGATSRLRTHCRCADHPVDDDGHAVRMYDWQDADTRESKRQYERRLHGIAKTRRAIGRCGFDALHRTLLTTTSAANAERHQLHERALA
ncbi:hypothetical protein [Paraburkholderia panacisoli]|uniref:hypothetical protein n=1 Tax=Paraburkholderia panacisoli TaxID=2603818 RepID=UPI001FED226D|nr:hypothetical protein [Paraburkholderia panacisoli]